MKGRGLSGLEVPRGDDGLGDPPASQLCRLFLLGRQPPHGAVELVMVDLDRGHFLPPIQYTTICLRRLSIRFEAWGRSHQFRGALTIVTRSQRLDDVVS